MIQLMVCLAVAISGALSLSLYIKNVAFERQTFAVVAPLAMTAIISAVMFVTMSLSIISTYIGGQAEIIAFEQTRAAVETIKPGDPSYSGILEDALRKTRTWLSQKSTTKASGGIGFTTTSIASLS